MFHLLAWYILWTFSSSFYQHTVKLKHNNLSFWDPVSIASSMVSELVSQEGSVLRLIWSRCHVPFILITLCASWTHIWEGVLAGIQGNSQQEFDTICRQNLKLLGSIVAHLGNSRVKQNAAVIGFNLLIISFRGEIC